MLTHRLNGEEIVFRACVRPPPPEILLLIHMFHSFITGSVIQVPAFY